MPRDRRSYPQRLRPPVRILNQWRRRARATGDRGYTRRWSEFWKRVACTAHKRPGWKDTDLHLVAEYVRRCRLAELHVEEAERDPYPANPDSGFLRPHPGWERSLAEAREARAIALQLALPPATRRAAGIDVPKIDNPREKPRSEAEEGWVDTQVGPDGQPL